jgi:hypothetical protein
VLFSKRNGRNKESIREYNANYFAKRKQDLIRGFMCGGGHNALETFSIKGKY